MTYAFVAAHTKTLRFGTGILVLPMRRDIVVVAEADRDARPLQ